MTQSQGKISKQLVTTWVMAPLVPGRADGPFPLVGSSWGAGLGGLGVGVLPWLWCWGCWGVC